MQGLLQTTSSDDKDVQQSIKQAAAKSTAGAKSYSAGAFDWTVSTLYYSAGILHCLYLYVQLISVNNVEQLQAICLTVRLAISVPVQ